MKSCLAMLQITVLNNFKIKYEQNEQMEAGNTTAAKANEKKEKHLCCFNAAYSDAMSVFLLFAEI